MDQFEIDIPATQQDGGHMLDRAQRRAGHRNKARPQRRADPMSRSEGLADAAPFANAKGKPLTQLELAKTFWGNRVDQYKPIELGAWRVPSGGTPKHRNLTGAALAQKLIHRTPH